MTTSSPRRRTWTTLVMILAFLVPAFFGFGTKFLEFLTLLGDQDGAFVVMPVLNYLLATLGFLMLLIWAMMHGMFRDLEKPKFTMLAQEEMLDRETLEEEEKARWL